MRRFQFGRTATKLRGEVSALGQENEKLRARAAELETKIDSAEKALSTETRNLLGVEE